MSEREEFRGGGAAVSPEEAKEDAEEILNDPSALEKKIAIEIVKSLLSSYYEVVRRKLVDTIPKVGEGRKGEG